MTTKYSEKIALMSLAQGFPFVEEHGPLQNVEDPHVGVFIFHCNEREKQLFYSD